MEKTTKLEKLIEKVLFFTDAYIPNQHFQKEKESLLSEANRKLYAEKGSYSNFETQYVKKSVARFLYERAGEKEKSAKLAEELVKSFEKEYKTGPLHCVWAHYIDALEHLHREEKTPEIKEKLLRDYTNISKMSVPPQLAISVWIRAPFRKYMLDGDKTEFLKTDWNKYLSELQKFEQDANSLMYGVHDEFGRLMDRSEQLIPAIKYISEHKSEF